MTLELGTTNLSEARMARGLTLEDAERSTRISRRFLIALEEHDYSVFPAPVYARGFLRTYCRYLGIDPEYQLAEMPPGWTASTLDAVHHPVVKPQSETVSTREPIRLNFSNFNLPWLIVGAILVAVVGLGLYFSRGGNDLGGLNTPEQQAQAGGPAGSTGANLGALLDGSQPTSTPSDAANGAEGRPLDAGLPGVLPDFEGVAVNDVTEFLDSQEIAYLRIDTASSQPAGIVIGQTPIAGADSESLAQVTLNVSVGPTQTGAPRTNCDVLEASNQRTAEEQAYFDSNCDGTTAPDATADRTNCEEIRGTDYRSPAEREFFLANCIT